MSASPATPLLRGWRVAAYRLGISLDVYQAHRERGERWCWKCQGWEAETDVGTRRHSCGRPLRSLSSTDERKEVVR